MHYLLCNNCTLWLSGLRVRCSIHAIGTTKRHVYSACTKKCAIHFLFNNYSGGCWSILIQINYSMYALYLSTWNGYTHSLLINVHAWQLVKRSNSNKRIRSIYIQFRIWLNLTSLPADCEAAYCFAVVHSHMWIHVSLMCYFVDRFSRH